MMENGKLALMVVGPHRSGTSAMTRVLALSGFNLPRTMLPPQLDNPFGFWESSVIVALNDEILAARDARWHDVFPPDEAPLLSSLSAGSLARAEAAIASEFGDASPIVLKDPRVSILTEFWKKGLERQGYASAFLIMVRNPFEVAASLAKRDGFSLERGLLIWLTNILATERKSRGDRRLFVTYERLLTDVFGILDDVESMIGEPLPRRTRAAEMEVQLAVNGEQRHHRAGNEIIVRRDLERLVADVYGWLLTSSSGETPSSGVLNDAAERLRVCEELVGGVLVELRQGYEAFASIRIGCEERLSQAQASLEVERLRGEKLLHELDVASDRSSALTASIKANHELLLAANASYELEHTSKVKLERDLADSSALLQAREQGWEAEKGAWALESQISALQGNTWTLERQTLQDLIQTQGRQMADLSVQCSDLSDQCRDLSDRCEKISKHSDDLSVKLRYIQSRIWWRAISRVKSLVERR